MTGLWPKQVQPGQDFLSAALPRYPAKLDSERAIVWTAPQPRPVSRWRLIAGSLADWAAAPVARVVAVVSAAGWVAATVVLAWVSVSGHVLSVVTGAQPVADTAVALGDIAAFFLLLNRRSRSDWPSRASRGALRRAQMATRPPGLRAFLWRRLQFLSLPSATASVPQPLRGLLVAGIWASVLAPAWQLATVMPGLGFYGDPSVQDQQFAASIWMMHLIAWCTIACRRFTRSRRSGQRLAGSQP